MKRRVANLNRYIDDLMFESRVRREIVSNTSAMLLQAYQASRATSIGVGAHGPADNSPVIDGRVH